MAKGVSKKAPANNPSTVKLSDSSTWKNLTRPQKFLGVAKEAQKRGWKDETSLNKIEDALYSNKAMKRADQKQVKDSLFAFYSDFYNRLQNQAIPIPSIVTQVVGKIKRTAVQIPSSSSPTTTTTTTTKTTSTTTSQAVADLASDLGMAEAQAQPQKPVKPPVVTSKPVPVSTPSNDNVEIGQVEEQKINMAMTKMAAILAQPPPSQPPTPQPQQPKAPQPPSPQQPPKAPEPPVPPIVPSQSGGMPMMTSQIPTPPVTPKQQQQPQQQQQQQQCPPGSMSSTQQPQQPQEPQQPQQPQPQQQPIEGLAGVPAADPNSTSVQPGTLGYRQPRRFTEQVEHGKTGDFIRDVPTHEPNEADLRPEYGMEKAGVVIPSVRKQLESDIRFDMFDHVKAGYGNGMDNKLFLMQEAWDKNIRYGGELNFPGEYTGPTAGVDVPPWQWQRVIPEDLIQKFQQEKKIRETAGAELLFSNGSRSSNVLGDDVGYFMPYSASELKRDPYSPFEPVIRTDMHWQQTKEPTGVSLNRKRYRTDIDSQRYPRMLDSAVTGQGGTILKKQRALEVILS